MQFKKRILVVSMLAASIVGLSMTPAQAQTKKLRFGFSQVTTLEPWRVQFNKDMKMEAAKHPELEFVIADAGDRTDKQVADMENFITQKMDVILISPKESAGLTGVVEKATAAGIPVIVLDRNVDTDKFVQYIGGDNRAIGRAAGKFIVKALGGEGKAQGNMIEIWGSQAVQAAHDRHDGVFESVAKEKGIKLLNERVDIDWKQDKAYEYMKTMMRKFPKIDVVYAQNDPMAYGAYLAAKDTGREKQIKFVGADALPQEGATWVLNGELAATFLYPTPGAEGIRQGLKLMKGEQIPKKVILDTEGVYPENAKAFIAAH